MLDRTAEWRCSLSIDHEDEGDSMLILAHEVTADGERFKANSGFKVEQLFGAGSRSVGKVKNPISGFPDDKYETLELLKFSAGSDSRESYLFSVALEEALDRPREHGVYTIHTKRSVWYILISGLKIREDDRIVRVVARLDKESAIPLFKSPALDQDVWFEIDLDFLFSANCICHRQRDEKGKLPTYRQARGPNPEDVVEFEYKWWENLHMQTPVIWEKISES